MRICLHTGRTKLLRLLVDERGIRGVAYANGIRRLAVFCVHRKVDAAGSRVGRVLEGGEALAIEMPFDADDTDTLMTRY